MVTPVILWALLLTWLASMLAIPSSITSAQMIRVVEAGR